MFFGLRWTTRIGPESFAIQGHAASARLLRLTLYQNWIRILRKLVIFSSLFRRLRGGDGLESMPVWTEFSLAKQECERKAKEPKN